MPKFFSPYSNPKKSVSEPECPKVVPDYILDESSGELIQSGTINTYERTQSYYESTKLSFKLARFGLGDTAALGVPHDCDINVCSVPGDLRAILDSRKAIEKQFSAFPPELRNLFRNDFTVFERSVSEGTADSIVSGYITKLTDSGKPGTIVEPSSDTVKSS